MALTMTTSGRVPSVRADTANRAAVRPSQAAPARTHATARPRAPRPLRAASVQAAPQTAVAAPGGAVDGKRVVALSSDEYEDFLAAHDCVLVDFCTEWCGPCKMIAPHLEEMAAEMPHVTFAKLNCTSDAAAKRIAMAQGVKALPTFHLFRKAERVGVFVGGKPQALRKFLSEQLS